MPTRPFWEFLEAWWFFSPLEIVADGKGRYHHGFIGSFGRKAFFCSPPENRGR